MQPKKILLVGNYNASNLGDEILKEVTLEKLHKTYPNAEVKLMCHRGDFPLFPAGIRSYLRLDYFKAKKALKWADLVIFGGGGLLNTEVPRSLLIWGKVIKMAKKAGLPVIMLGQSFSSRITANLDKLLSRLDFLTVRDSASEVVLKKLELEVPFLKTADLAFAYEPIVSFQTDLDFEEYSIINLREYKKLNTKDTLELASRFIQEILNKTALGVYLCPYDKVDAKILSLLEERFKDSGRVKIKAGTLAETLSLVKGAEFIIAQRLHCAISALLLGKPVLALSYASKVESLFRDMELEENIIDLRIIELNNFEASLDFVDNMPKVNLNDLKKKALSNFEILKTLVQDL